jgi:hypothetical protein
VVRKYSVRPLNSLKTRHARLGKVRPVAIEQNAGKPSRWGHVAREGHRVVQFKEVQANRFVAVAVDGEVTVYGAGHRVRKQ